MKPKYLSEAEIAKNRIAELRQQQELKRMESLKSKHLSQKLEIEQGHLEEFNAFNQLWDGKHAELEERSKELERQTDERHKKEFEDATEHFKMKTPEKAKPTAEILNLKRIQDNLARQKE